MDFIAKHSNGDYTITHVWSPRGDMVEGVITNLKDEDKLLLAIAKNQEEINKILSHYIK